MLNILLIKPNIILQHILFIKYLQISKISLMSIGLKPTEKKFATPLNLVLYTLLIVKSFEILPKYSA